jgi:hypothetical protein
VNESYEILARCHQYGIRLGLGLRVEGWSKAPADFQEDIRSYRDELLNLLLSQSSKNGFDAERSTGRTTPWGIPIADGYDPADPVFQRHPLECDCFRAGVLRCGVPCVWAWPPGAKPGDKAQRIKRCKEE